MLRTRFQHKSFFVGSDTREAIKSGKADYIPISIAEALFGAGHRLTAADALSQPGQYACREQVNLIGAIVEISPQG